MLSREETELLCHVGPGTPMGGLLREYWMPVLRSPALLAGGDPQRVRILGENWVAFRARDGRVAIVDEACPHRGVSLALGRNEECGLRCLYHGWVVSVEGKVVETPNDPGLERPERIPVRSVPVREAGQMIWAWFGKGEPPIFPDFVFNRLPAGEQVRVVCGKIRANWLQVVENLWDPLHTAILHGPGNKEHWEGVEGHPSYDHGSPIYESFNTPPQRVVPTIEFEVEHTDYGFRFRTAFSYSGTNAGIWNPTVMPAWLFAGGAGVGHEPDADKIVGGHTPVDDENTLFWLVVYNPAKAIGPVGASFADTAHDPDNFVLAGFDADHDWLQDRQAMAERRSYSGLGVDQHPFGVFLEDVAMCESMGIVADRGKEHLCKADLVIAHGRRMYLNAVRAHQRGEPPLGRDFHVNEMSLRTGPEHAERRPAPGRKMAPAD